MLPPGWTSSRCASPPRTASVLAIGLAITRLGAERSRRWAKKASTPDLAHALAWVDQHFIFSPLSDPTRIGVEIPTRIQGVVLDPFYPFPTQKPDQSHHEHQKQTLEAMKNFAVALQVHLWLVALPAPSIDLRPPETERRQIEEDMKSSILTGGLTREEQLAAFAPLPLPQPPAWAGWGGCRVVQAKQGPAS
jgi:hypothetical protein